MAARSRKKNPATISMASSSSSSSSSSSHQTSRINKRRRVNVLVAVFLLLGAVAVLGISSITWRIFSIVGKAPEIYTIQVVNEFPHDPQAFTQGLLYVGNGTLFESTGLYGKSSVRRVDLETGKVQMLQKMDTSYFGEGLTLLGERLFQVTWLKKTGFIYDRNNLTKIGKFTHQMQDGWGLATDGNVLFGSDGSATLYQLDPQSLKVIQKQIVRFHGHEVRFLNELEFVNGEVWANIWQTDCIARISPDDGYVVGWILLPNLRTDLVAAGHHGIDVLNGIAWDSDSHRLFVTGKLWPKLYEIKLLPLKKEVKAGVIERLCIR